MRGQPRRQYYWELREFKQCSIDAFKEMQYPQTQYIYFFKRDVPDVIVRVYEPLEKIHSWIFKELEVLQRLNDNPRVFHWKHVYMPLNGELVLSQLDAFNRLLKEQIEESIPKRTKPLQRWIDSALDDVFLVKLKANQQNDAEKSIFQIKTLCRTRYKNYFEMRSWKGPSWQGLLEIADEQKMSKSCSFGCHLQEANNAIAAIDINQQEDLLRMGSKRKMSSPLWQKQQGQKIMIKQSLSFN